MKSSLIPFLIIACILTACGPKINKEQREDLAQLTKKVNKSVEAIRNIDSAKIMEANTNFIEMKEYVTNDIQDTLSRATIFFLDSFTNLRKPFSYLSTEYSPLKKEALAMQKQLKTLNQDVENRLVDEEHFENYYGLEQHNYLQLEKAVNQMEKLDSSTIENYNRMKPRVNKIIEASKSKTNE